MIAQRFIDRHFRVLFLAPGLLLLTGLIVIPSLLTLGYSAFDWTLTRPGSVNGVGVRNYIRMLTRFDFLSALRNTLVFVIGTVSAEVILGFSIASLINRRYGISAFARLTVLLPMMLSPMATAISWRAMFFQEQFGLFNYLLGLLNISGPSWLGDPQWSLVTVMIMNVWLATPFVALFMLAGLQSVPQSLIESAQLDGASRPKIIIHVIIPVMKNVVVVAVVLRTIFDLRVFAPIFALTRGGPGLSSTTLGILAYREAFTYWRIGMSGAMATLLFIMSFAMTIAYVRLLKDRKS